MKVYNVTIDNEVVSTFKQELDAHQAHTALCVLMPTSNIKMVESFVEERSVKEEKQ